jgi:hypothetical protein
VTKPLCSAVAQSLLALRCHLFLPKAHLRGEWHNCKVSPIVTMTAFQVVTGEVRPGGGCYRIPQKKPAEAGFRVAIVKLLTRDLPRLRAEPPRLAPGLDRALCFTRRHRLTPHHLTGNLAAFAGARRVLHLLNSRAATTSARARFRGSQRSLLTEDVFSDTE